MQQLEVVEGSQAGELNHLSPPHRGQRFRRTAREIREPESGSGGAFPLRRVEIVDEHPPDVQLVRVAQQAEEFQGFRREPFRDLEDVMKPYRCLDPLAFIIGKKVEQGVLPQYLEREMGVVQRIAVFEGPEIPELREAPQVMAQARHFGKHPEPWGVPLCDQARIEADVAGVLFLQVEVALNFGVGGTEGTAVGGKPGMQRRQVGERCCISHRASS